MPTPLDNYLDQDYLKKNYLGRNIKFGNDLYQVTENGLISQGAMPSGKTQDYYNSLKLLEFNPFENGNRMGGLYDNTLTADNTNTLAQMYQAFNSDYKSTLPQSVQNIIGFAPGSVAGQSYVGAPVKSGFEGAPPVQQGAMPTSFGGVNPEPIKNVQGTTPYYGSIQDLANKGLQISGGKVYENGQIIGTYGGVSPAAVNDGTTITSQPGQGEVVTLSNGQKAVRNLEKEKTALAEFQAIYKKNPNEIPDGWTKLHDLAYAGDKKAVIPPEYEKIGHPDQISQYEDVQRVGKVGEPGSYLYGKKKIEVPENLPASPIGGGTTTGGTTDGATGGATGGVAGGSTASPDATAADPYRQKLLDMITQLGTGQKDYLDYLKSQPTATDTYSKLREQLGLSAKEKGLEGIRGQVAETESLLDKLEDDINSRISGKGISEALRRRLLASEGSPLREQLADLVKGQGLQEQSLSGTRQQLADMLSMSRSDQEQAAKIAGQPIENLKSLLPLYESAYTYQSPAEKAKADLAASLAKEQAYKSGGLGSYYEAPKTSTDYDTIMLKEGYNYVSTPKERDQLKAKGYTITTLGGRTYAKAPEKKTGENKTTPTNKFKQIETGLLSQAGGDGFVSPDDYALAKADWIQAGGAPADFDTKFKNRRNPENPYYNATKTTNSTGDNNPWDFNNF